MPKWIEKKLLEKGFKPNDGPWFFVRHGSGEFWAARYHKDKHKNGYLISVSSYTGGYIVEILRAAEPAIRAENKKFITFL